MALCSLNLYTMKLFQHAPTVPLQKPHQNLKVSLPLPTVSIRSSPSLCSYPHQAQVLPGKSCSWHGSTLY